MAYRLKAGESVPENLKRIVIEELDSAADQLNQNGRDNRDEAIHEARKSVKKVRAVLRLVRPELGATYRKENRRFRDLGTKLSELRDAAAIIETFDAVVEKYKDSLQKNTLSSIRLGLDNNKHETEKTADSDKVVKLATASLRSAKKRVASWPLDRYDGFRAIAPGLKATFRNGRNVMRLAQKDPRPQNYHEWRKRVKDLWYHVRLLENLWAGVMQAHEASLKDLETWLGDDHNIVVLREKLQSQPDAYGDQKDIQLFLTLADQFQKELRENALSLGRRIYEEKPRQFTKNIGKLWDAWQQQPDSMKQEQKEERQATRKGARSAASAQSTKSTMSAA